MTCAHCEKPIEDETPITDPDTGDTYHVICLLRGVPEEAAVMLLNLVAVAVPPVVALWGV